MSDETPADEVGPAPEAEADQDARLFDPGPGTPFQQVREIVVGDPDLSLEEVADAAGLPLQVLREVFAAMDWDHRPAYDERDVAYARDIARLLDTYPLDTLTRTLRYRHRVMTSMVVADMGAVRDLVVQPALAAGASIADLSEQLARAAEELLPLSTRNFGEDYRHVLVGLMDSEAVASGVLKEDREVDLAVGFVDVVGYTALSGRVDPAGLDRVLASFEDLANQAVSRADNVLLSKFVGDAAMLVSPELEALVDVLLGLIEDRERLGEAPRRAGVSAGPVLVREGDFYGVTTNLAARLTDHARPWTLLADETLRETLAPHFDLTEIPKVELRGVGERRPLRVRRGE